MFVLTRGLWAAQYFWGSAPLRFAPHACACVCLHGNKAKCYENQKIRGGRSLGKAPTVDFKVFFGGWLCRAGAKQASNRSAHACDQHYSCSENKQTQQQGKELTGGAGGEPGDLFFWHVRRGWGWISCIYSVERGKKRRQKSKASFIAPEKTKIFNNSPIATPLPGKKGEKGEKK